MKGGSLGRVEGTGRVGDVEEAGAIPRGHGQGQHPPPTPGLVGNREPSTGLQQRSAQDSAEWAGLEVAVETQRRKLGVSHPTGTRLQVRQGLE